MEIDLHGYHPAEIVFNGVLSKILQQAWEMGESDLTLIHGHGRNRGITPGFVNTNTGYFGLCIRRALRNDQSLRQWMKHTTLDCRQTGCTSIGLKPNSSPTRTQLDCFWCAGYPLNWRFGLNVRLPDLPGVVFAGQNPFGLRMAHYRQPNTSDSCYKI